ncbi:MAG: 2Fe-2S iron-sulfur cluster binding domain-containing protein [Aureispira sp.]|nr:2Fe-2S iron-sulfur cluster binding domain-containing protein [Aureispira sp.]
MAIIKFSFEDSSIAPKEVVATLGDTILDAAHDNDIHINHNCGEVCACSTCHIYVENGDDVLQEISDREEDFIDRAINPRIESRLACQCELVEDDKDLVIEVVVPDQSRIIGHEH